MLLSIKSKLLGSVLAIEAFVFFTIGFAVFYKMQNTLMENLQSHMLVLAKAAAGAIDAEKHSGFISNNIQQDQGYQNYYRYLKSIRDNRNDNYITSIYTLNYNKAADTFYYGVDGTESDSDTVLFESKLIAFTVKINEKGLLTVIQNTKEYTEDFSVRADSIDFNFTIVNRGRTRLLKINDNEIIKVLSDNPLVVLTAGQELHRYKRKLKIKMKHREKETLFHLSFTGKGESATDPGSEFIASDSDINLFRAIFFKGEDTVDSEIRSTTYGDDITAYAMIRNSKGDPIGILAAYLDTKAIQKFKESYIETTFLVFAGTFIISLILAHWIVRYFSKPIELLSKGVNSISSGDLNAKVEVVRRDELGNLAESFNAMVEQVRNSTADLNSTINSYSRFVPAEFIRALGYDKITEVQLGDGLQKDMTILFSDIRSFTSLSEGMTPKQNFNFINGYLGRISPVIRKNAGFIDKYIGDAVMALFGSKSEDAILAAIEMHREIFAYNSHRKSVGYSQIQIGVGLHRGNVILGTVGDEKRMECTVIADAVNTASRLENMTKQFSSGIILSGDVYRELTNKEICKFRYLGKFKVRGKFEPLDVYEVLDALAPEILAERIVTLHDFKEAVELYQNRRFYDSIAILKNIQKKTTRDRAVNYYYQRVSNLLQYGLPENWDGVEILDEK